MCFTQNFGGMWFVPGKIYDNMFIFRRSIDTHTYTILCYSSRQSPLIKINIVVDKRLKNVYILFYYDKRWRTFTLMHCHTLFSYMRATDVFSRINFRCISSYVHSTLSDLFRREWWNNKMLFVIGKVFLFYYLQILLFVNVRCSSSRLQ